MPYDPPHTRVALVTEPVSGVTPEGAVLPTPSATLPGPKAWSVAAGAIFARVPGALNETLQGGSLDQLTRGAVYLETSDYNGCTYWLSAHSAVAEPAGMSQDEIERAQRFESEDEQRAAALRFGREVVEKRGHPSEEALEEVWNANYTDEQTVEMVAT